MGTAKKVGMGFWKVLGVMFVVSLAYTLVVGPSDDDAGSEPAKKKPARKTSRPAPKAPEPPAPPKAPKIPAEFSWAEAQAFLTENGATDIRVGADGKSLRGAFQDNRLIVFDFDAEGASGPPRCIFVDYGGRAGNWRSTVEDYFGTAPAGVPGPKFEQGKKAFEVKTTARGTIWIRGSANLMERGNGVWGLTMGPDCDLIHD